MDTLSLRTEQSAMYQNQSWLNCAGIPILRFFDLALKAKLVKNCFLRLLFWPLLVLLSLVSPAFGQALYDFEVIVQTGTPLETDGTVNSLGWGLSIDDLSNVAFTGCDTNQCQINGIEGVFVGDGTASSEPETTKVEVVEINDRDTTGEVSFSSTKLVAGDIAALSLPGSDGSLKVLLEGAGSAEKSVTLTDGVREWTQTVGWELELSVEFELSDPTLEDDDLVYKITKAAGEISFKGEAVDNRPFDSLRFGFNKGISLELEGDGQLLYSTTKKGVVSLGFPLNLLGEGPPEPYGIQFFSDEGNTGTARLLVDFPSRWFFDDAYDVSGTAPLSGLPGVTIETTDSGAVEDGADTGTFTVKLDKPTDDPLVIKYGFEGSSAINRVDYFGENDEELSGEVTILAGESSATITVNPITDTEFECAETVRLTLQTGEGYTVGSLDQATIIIADSNRPCINRWWAEVGDSFEASWYVPISQEGEFTLNVGFKSSVPLVKFPAWRFEQDKSVVIEGGTLSSPRTATLKKPGFPGFKATADIRNLKPGSYLFTIRQFDAPDEAIVEEVTFNLTPAPSPEHSEFKALFVADHPEDLQIQEYDILVPGEDGARTFSDLRQLVTQFAPILHYDNGETARGGAERFVHPYDAEEILANQPLSGGSITGSLKQELDLSALNRFRPLGMEKIYASVLKKSDVRPLKVGEPDELAINYWFHYPLSNWLEHGGFNNHEGDWEGVTVFLEWNANNNYYQPHRLALGQHSKLYIIIDDGGEWVPWDRVNTSRNEAQPDVYVGLGGHASYHACGEERRFINFPIGSLRESHFGNLTAFVAEENQIVYLGRVGEKDKPDWLLFPGFWGRQNIEDNDSSADDGPPGPVFQSLGFGPGKRWLDPWEWSKLFNEAEQAVATVECDDLNEEGLVTAIDDGSGTNSVIQTTEGSDAGMSDAAIKQTVELSEHVLGLLFDYHFTQKGDGDSLIVKINDDIVWTRLGTEYTGTPLQSSEIIDLTLYAGQSVELEFRLLTVGEANSQVWLDNITILNQPVSVLVPDVVGLPQADAEAALADAGLEVGSVFFESSDTVPVGEVISQGPAAGSNVEVGSTVDLVASSGPADLEVIGFEVIQSIQSWNNDVELIENKTTYVRAHVQPTDSAPGQIAGVMGNLYGTRDGNPLPGSPLQSMNSITAQANATARRAEFNDSLNFHLPAEWLTGTIDLRFEVIGESVDCTKAAALANDCTMQATFLPTAQPAIKFIGVEWDQQTLDFDCNRDNVLDNQDTTCTPTITDIDGLEQRLTAMFPIAGVDRKPDGLLTWNRNGRPNVADVTDRLRSMQFWDSCWAGLGCETLYYGAVPGNVSSGLLGIAAGIPSRAASAFMPLTSFFFPGRQIHSHEIGHSLNRHHAPFCGAVVGPTAPTFPYTAEIDGQTVATLGPLDMGEDALIYGLDTAALNDPSFTDSPVIDPHDVFEVMSYCLEPPFDFWISQFTYEGLRDSINSTFGGPVIVPQPQASQAYMVVRGRVDFQNDTVEFFPFGNIESTRAPPGEESGDYMLKLMDDSGAVVQEVPFEPVRYSVLSVGPDPEPEIGSFIIPIPEDPMIKEAVVVRNGNVLASVTASPNPPTVTVLFPNGGESLSGDQAVLEWIGSDLDGDPLTYIVQYSSDGGTTWDTLATDWTEEQYAVDLNLLGETTNGRIRVIASDGFNTATDESDGPFSIDQTTPGVPVPDVIGASRADAEAAIVGAGLVVGTITTEPSATVPEGDVIRTIPAAMTGLSPGSTVDLVISSGPPIFCGDGTIDPGEECDDGGLNSDIAPDACRTDCTLPVCGDSVTDPGNGEECDDGNTAPGDGCSSTCLIETSAPGKIVLNNDEWTLSNTGFSRAPDTATFALNVASWFTGGSPGNFLVFSSNFGLTGSSLASTMSGAGHTWTVDTSLPFNLTTLLGFDGVFLSGTAGGTIPDNNVLIQYVENGGNVYLAGGTLGAGGFSSASQEAGAWNSFLNHFDLAFAGSAFNGITGTVSINNSHPIFSGVNSLYQASGNSVLDLDLADPSAEVLVFSNSNGLYAVFDADVLPPELGTITIRKVANPTDGQDFSFSSDLGNFTLDDAAPDDNDAVTSSMIFSAIPVGDYNVTESLPAGWALDNVVCTGGSSDPIANGVLIHLGPEEQITCTFSNTLGDACPDDPDKIEPGLCGCGVPDTDPLPAITPVEGMSSGIFVNPIGPAGMVTTGVGTDSFTWGDEGAFGTGPSSLNFAGNTFSEMTEAEFVLGTLRYFNGTVEVGSQVDTIDLQVTAAFTTPAGVTEDFTFMLELINSPNVVGTPPEAQADIVSLPSIFANTVFTIDGIAHTLKLTFGDVTAGGFSEIDRFFVLENETATAELRASITSCVSQLDLGSITVLKAADPTDGQDFSFNGDLGDFVLDDANPDDTDSVADSMTFSALTAGDYTVTEVVPAGWALNNVECTGGDSTPLSDGVTIHLDPSEHITCTFMNTAVPELGSITIMKTADPADGQDFSFTGSLGNFVLDDADPDDNDSVTDSMTFTALPAGDYTVTEALPAEWVFDGAVCTGGDSTPLSDGVTIHLDPSEHITCTFMNTKTTTEPPSLLDPFVCYTTRATRGSICAEEAPVNAGGECESEPDCGGEEETTSLCISNEFPKGFQVSLVDQFEDKDFDLKKPLNLCTPADKNGEGIIDEETHLRGYRIKAVRKSCMADAPANPLGACENEHECGGVEEETRFCDQTPRHVKQTNVRVDNQFGTLFVNTENPEHLLVPTAKDLLNPIEAPDPATHDVDHFKCYTVKVQRRMCEQEASLTCRRDADCGALGPCNMGFERGQQVTIANQFIEPAKLFDVREPTQLCTPVDKNGEGIKNAAAHLMCYKIKRAKGEPEHDKVPGIHVNNQFGPEQLDTKKEEELCVPSVKTVQ